LDRNAKLELSYAPINFNFPDYAPTKVTAHPPDKNPDSHGTDSTTQLMVCSASEKATTAVLVY